MARGQELELAIVPSAEFPKDQLRSRASRVFGCDPDFNVWAMRPNPSPKCDNPCLRSAGGHIHFGGEFKDKIALGRAADLFIGCPSIVYDSDVKRRSLYGKAGAVRDKPYGLEYRTVSNFWLKGHMNMVRQQAIQATEFEGDIPIEDGKKIMACINETNMDCLKELTVKYGLRY
jgi:hypothetical protein